MHSGDQTEVQGGRHRLHVGGGGGSRRSYSCACPYCPGRHGQGRGEQVVQDQADQRQSVAPPIPSGVLGGLGVHLPEMQHADVVLRLFSFGTDIHRRQMTSMYVPSLV